jgi:hypothetical protein
MDDSGVDSTSVFGRGLAHELESSTEFIVFSLPEVRWIMLYDPYLAATSIPSIGDGQRDSDWSAEPRGCPVLT